MPPSPQTVIEMLSISGVLLSIVWGLYVLAIGAVGVVGNCGWRGIWRSIADWVVLLERGGVWCGERRHDGPGHG